MFLLYAWGFDLCNSNLNSFGKGGMFGPYTPLQQLDVLADKGTKSYIVGSTNSLLLQQKDRYSDVLINVRGTLPRRVK